MEYVALQATRIEGLIASAERGLDLLDEYRTRLIADMVTGKLDVREAAVRLPTRTNFPSQCGGGSPGNTLDSGRSVPLECASHSTSKSNR